MTTFKITDSKRPKELPTEIEYNSVTYVKLDSIGNDQYVWIKCERCDNIIQVEKEHLNDSISCGFLLCFDCLEESRIEAEGE